MSRSAGMERIVDVVSFQFGRSPLHQLVKSSSSAYMPVILSLMLDSGDLTRAKTDDLVKPLVYTEFGKPNLVNLYQSVNALISSA